MSRPRSDGELSAEAAPSRVWLERALVALLVALFAWRGLVPGWQHLHTDFGNYYLAARAYRDGLPLERLYDWIWIQRLKDHAGLDQSFVGYVPLTLFSALVVAPLASLPALAAKRCWLMLSLVLLVATGWLLRRLTGLRPRQVALLVFLAIVPLRTNFQFGQQHVLLLFLITLAAWLYFDERKLAAGGVLALAAALKLYPALFGLMLLRKRQWRALLGLGAGALGLALVGLALFGREPWRVYLGQVLPRALLRGEVTDPYSLHLASFSGLLRRLLVFEPQLNPHPLAHAPTAFAILQPLCGPLILVPGLWLMTPGGAPPAEEKLDWATFVSLLLLLSSAAASYHFCVLILSAALAAGALLQAGRRKQALLLLLCYALVSFPLDRIVPSSPGGWAIFLGYPRLYAMAAFCLVLAWARHGHRDPRAPRPSRVEGATLGVAFVALVLGGVVSNLRHFKGQFESYPRRLATWSLMAAEPMTAGREVYFSRMDEESFVVDRIGDGPVTVGLPSVDLFHPAVTAGEAEGWLEIAGTTSRIARFRRDASRLSVRDLPIEVEDGEEPAISADGRWLAFIRRERGRGSLWLLDRRGGEPGLPMAGAPRKIVEASRDVLDLAFFPDGQIVFAGRQGDRSKLFAVDPHLPHSPHAPHAPEPRELATSDRSVRNPAVSIDGRWLAYAELDGGNWQLWAMPLPEGPRRRLTEADCNSVSPSWFPDSKTLVYATDCGRGIGHTALAWLAAAP